LQNEIGSLEAGKRADVTVVNLNSLHSTPNAKDLVSALVYSGQTSDVQSVVIAGKIVMKDRKLLTIDEESVIAEAGREGAELFSRAGIQA
jgi:5-methylthioadenosine/S-adenosylhomocysteine deaminase